MAAILHHHTVLPRHFSSMTAWWTFRVNACVCKWTKEGEGGWGFQFCVHRQLQFTGEPQRGWLINTAAIQNLNTIWDNLTQSPLKWWWQKAFLSALNHWNQFRRWWSICTKVAAETFHNVVKQTAAFPLKRVTTVTLVNTATYRARLTFLRCRAARQSEAKEKRLSKAQQVTRPALTISPLLLLCIQRPVVQSSLWPHLHPHPPTLPPPSPHPPFFLRVVVCLFVFSSCLYRKCEHPN